jgi:DNA polymerase-3 subunit delta
MVFGANITDEKALSATIGVNPFFIKDYLKAAKLYNYTGVEKALLLMHSYNLKSVGVGDAGTEDASLLKEMIVKMID